MYSQPEMMFFQAAARHRELIEEADQYRLLALARRARRSRRARARDLAAAENAGTLTACKQNAAPAR